MEWNSYFDPELRIFHITKTSAYSLDDHRRSLDEMFASDSWQPGMPVLSDITNLEMTVPSSLHPEETRDLFRSFADQLVNTKWAMLCRTDLQYGLARQLEMLCESLDCPEMRVFRDKTAAINWLTR